MNGDGCGLDCTIEPGYRCSQALYRLSQCNSICGDAFITVEEAVMMGIEIQRMVVQEFCRLKQKKNLVRKGLHSSP